MKKFSKEEPQYARVEIRNTKKYLHTLLTKVFLCAE
jgi:hypothetical protein